MIKKIIENFGEEEILTADGFDDAVIGYDQGNNKVVYSIEKCISLLCSDMCEEDASEYFYFNVHGSYVGPNTPSFVFTLP